MRFREATVEDMVQLIELWKGYEEYHNALAKGTPVAKFLETTPNAKKLMKDYFLKAIKSKEAAILIAEEGREVTGFIYVCILNASPISVVEKVGHLGYLFVKEGYKGDGIGDKLMNNAIDWLRKRKIKRISLEVNALNKRVKEYYGRIGFTDFEIIMMRDL